MPPTAMIAPARMKNGIASSEKPLMPPETLSMTASSGMPVHSAARIAASPSAYATGMPARHATVKLPMRMRMSITQVRRGVYSVEIWLTVSGSGCRKKSCVRRRSITNRTVSAPPMGIGR